MGNGEARFFTQMRGASSRKDQTVRQVRLSSSLVLTCWTTLENDWTGQQTAVHTGPGLGQTDCPVENTGCNSQEFNLAK